MKESQFFSRMLSEIDWNNATAPAGEKSDVPFQDPQKQQLQLMVLWEKRPLESWEVFRVSYQSQDRIWWELGNAGPASPHSATVHSQDTSSSSLLS